MQWVIAAVLFCSSTVFTSCSNEDNSVGPTDNLAEKLIGKWMPVYLDGNPVVTDLKSVYTFVSATKAYMSVSINAQQGEEIVWNNQKELDLSINGSKMTLTNHSDEHTTMVEEFNITAIDGSAFTANHKITVTVDGSVMLHNEGTIRFENSPATTARQSSAYGNVKASQAARLTTMITTVWSSSKMARINIGVRMTLVCGKK